MTGAFSSSGPDSRESIPTVSVIVPIYNDWHKVPSLLNALYNQSLPREQFEIILVDNGSESCPDSLAFSDMSVLLLSCRTPGSYSARNIGVQKANGALLAFTDADCLPVSLWLEKALSCMAGHDQTLIAGKVSMVRQDDKLEMTPAEQFDLVCGIPQARYVMRGYATTANLLVPREIFNSIGLFDETRFSGGDAEFCRRAIRYGYKLYYCKLAEVEHPARRSLEELLIKVRRIKGGQICSGAMTSRIIWIIRTMLPPLRDWVFVLRAHNFPMSGRLSACGVRFRMWMTEIAECCHLIAGGRPVRR